MFNNILENLKIRKLEINSDIKETTKPVIELSIKFKIKIGVGGTPKEKIKD